MAEQVQCLMPPSSVERSSILTRYPFDEWANRGGYWEVKHGVDYEITTRSFRSYLYQFAAKNHIKVRTYMIDKDTLRFKFDRPSRKLPNKASTSAATTEEN